MTFDLDIFLNDLKARRSRVDAELQRRLPAENIYPPLIHQAMAYAIFNGGKRLRPMMVLEGARLAGGDPEDVLLVACALELIHSYSLVHDDLPAMDDDDFRRGKPTCHRVFGDANAILTGDALLTLAFEWISSTAMNETIDSLKLLRVIQEVSCAAGSRGMVGGQVLDLDDQNQVGSLAQLQTLHSLKTGELFKASLRAGAILGGMNEEGLLALTDYAHHFGLAFQITDDILDVIGDQQVLGKPVGSDERNCKTTYTSLLGMEGARQRAEQCVEACQNSLSIFGQEADFLKNLAQFTLQRKL